MPVDDYFKTSDTVLYLLEHGEVISVNKIQTEGYNLITNLETITKKQTPPFLSHIGLRNFTHTLSLISL